MGLIRVGRIIYDNNRVPQYPKYDGYKKYSRHDEITLKMA